MSTYTGARTIMITLAETVTLMGGPKVLVTALREYLHSINENKPWKKALEGDTPIKVCQCLRKNRVSFEIRCRTEKEIPKDLFSGI